MTVPAAVLSELGQAALAYAARGWHVFPLAPGSKVPLISKRMGGNGHKDATTDPEQIRRWWSATPNANIGLNCAASGLVAVDPDTYKPECEWAGFIRGRDLPDTLVQSTPRGGKHYIFQAPPGAQFDGEPCKGVEIKHDGYIALEPSSFEGRQYQFETDDDLALAPEWIPRKGAQEPREAHNVFRLDAGDKGNRERLTELLRGVAAHDNSRDLVASLIRLGVPPRAVHDLASAAVMAGLEPGQRRSERLARLDYHVRSAVEKYAPEGERQSTFYSAATLKGKPVPSRQWLVDGLVPKKTVTLFSGDGGTGKSLLALQLAVAAAAERAWMGKAVNSGRVIFLSAEDDDDELHIRLNDILRAERLDYTDVEGLTLRSLAGEDALLAVETQLALMQSALFRELEQRAADEQPALIVLDTLADVFPANENDRAKVRQFIGILRGLALRQRCAVMLLGHPSLTGLSSGTGTSGSTAWNNSVRSRLYLSRIVQDGYEPDPDKRVMSTKKANYGRIGGEINMTWREGVFVPDEQPTGLDALAVNAKAERVFLTLLGKLTEQGRRVNAAGGHYYAPKVFADHPDCEGVTKRAFKAAMERLLSAGKVRVAEYGPPSKRHTYLEVAQ